MERFIALLWNSPARVVMMSFLGVALAGALLLMLPAATEPNYELGFLDAFFTATSAVCVTGLIVTDTPAAFTLFGRAVILILIQIGGLGIMAFSLASIALVRKRLTASEAELLSFMLNQKNRTQVKNQLIQVIVYTAVFELLGTIVLSVAMRHEASSLQGALGLGLFHAVSAFCNAGFALYSDSLVRFSADPTVTIAVSTLIVAGGIGFSTMILVEEELTVVLRRVVHRATRVFRSRGITAPGRLYTRSVAARTAVIGSLSLIGVGTLLFYLLETGGTMQGLPLGEKYLISFFQSVTLRTAGFNSVAFDRLALTTVLVMVPFMFIGGASGGTAGGIKIGTITVLIADMRRYLRGDEHAVLFERKIERNVITQAMVLLTAGLITALIATTILATVETAPLEALLFEVVSALGTVGLSLGITASLSPLGRVVIILLMFVGRLGPLTLLTALHPKTSRRELRFPNSDIVVG